MATPPSQQPCQACLYLITGQVLALLVIMLLGEQGRAGVIPILVLSIGNRTDSGDNGTISNPPIFGVGVVDTYVGIRSTPDK